MRRWVALAATVPMIITGTPAQAAPVAGPGGGELVRAWPGTASTPERGEAANRSAAVRERAGVGVVAGRGEVAGALRKAAAGRGVVGPGVARALQRVAGGRYVALGDSFTSGPLIPRQHGKPFACLRSDHNYPSLVAHALRAGVFADVSCSAATTADLFKPQHVLFGNNPAQLAAVTPETALVTVGIGGNDVGFSKTLYTCAGLSVTAPKGAPCMKHFGATLTDRVNETAPRIAAVLRTIHARAPHALVVLVGYLRILPSATGCWPSVPTAAGDVPYLDRVERSLNRMLADEARRGAAIFVDDYSGGTGHDMCSAHRWVEPIFITHAAMPVHPNALGMRIVAGRVVATLGAARSAAARGQ
jgi:lysophospholipase L1-like esterase